MSVSGVPGTAGEPGRVPAGATAEDLAALAAAHPELWGEIADHPNAYAGLRSWIADRRAETETTTLAAGDLETETETETVTVAATGPYWPAEPAAPAVAPSFSDVLAPAPGSRGTGQPVGFGVSAPAQAPMPFGAPDPRPPANGSRGPAKPRRAGRVVLASVLAGALVIGGGTALALTGTWPFGAGPLGGITSGVRAQTAAETEAVSFADGIEERWEISGEDFGATARLVGHLPRMMGPVNELVRADQPTQIDAGVLLQYRPDDSQGDVPNDWALLDPETGEAMWTEEGLGGGNGCYLNAEGDEAACSISFVANQEVVRFGADGIVDRYRSDEGYAESVHYERDRLVWTDLTGVSEVALDGGDPDRRPVAGASSAGIGNAEAPDCSWLYASGTVSWAGPACTEDEAEIVSDAEAYNWAVIDQETPRYLIDTTSEVKLIDAETREVIWKTSGTLSFDYRAPQIVTTGTGDKLLLQRAEGNTPSYVLVDADDGSETPLEGSAGDGAAVVAGDEVLLFQGAAPYGDPIDHVSVFDPDDGGLLAEYDIPAVEDVAEIIGGPHGVMFGHRFCTDCSTAEGSHAIDRYTFFGPAEHGSGSDSGTVEASIVLPESIPVSCPGDTVLLAWAEVSEGWVVVCGVRADEPSYVVYAPSDGGGKTYSRGADDPSGTSALDAVSWDEEARRYTAEMESGDRLVLDYDMGTVTVRAGDGSSTVSQERFVRYVFVPMGDSVRTVKDAAESEGAFEVRSPDESGEDQVRYMVEVLEKAYEGRALVKEALPKLRGCTAAAGGYGDSVSAMESVRDNRAELLAALDAMPVDRIPEGEALLDELWQAISYSHEANVEYVAWAEAANASGCASLSAAGERAAAASDDPKERFAARWNRVVAPRYGVRTFDAWYI